MSVTITRRTIIALAQESLDRSGVLENSREATGFRTAITEGHTFARGSVAHTMDDGTVIDCPVRQAGLWPAGGYPSDNAVNIAYAWDEVTSEHGMQFADIVRVNPYT
jgi:hypothetical protein